jgi:hypothetical protein
VNTLTRQDLATILGNSRKLSPEELRLVRRFAVFFPQSVKNASITDTRRASGAPQQVLGNDRLDAQLNVAADAVYSQLTDSVVAGWDDCRWIMDVEGSNIPIPTQASMMWNQDTPGMEFSFLNFFGGSEDRNLLPA